ncbi:MAG: HAD family phosphatase [bacterium]
MKRYEAVLFDFDGVLARTMEDNYNAWKYAFSLRGIDITKEEYFLLEGASTKKVAEHFLGENAGNPEMVRETVDMKEKYYMDNNKFSLYEGAEELVRNLKKKKYLLGLVSGASRERLSKSVQQSFLSLFDVVITGDDTDNCKPAPDSYLAAAERLTVAPSGCVVVENAPMGIEAAVRAGMYCVAVCSTLDRKYLEKADKIIHRLTEIKKVL